MGPNATYLQDTCVVTKTAYLATQCGIMQFKWFYQLNKQIFTNWLYIFDRTRRKGRIIPKAEITGVEITSFDYAAMVR